jgi:hypothetical protein
VPRAIADAGQRNARTLLPGLRLLDFYALGGTFFTILAVNNVPLADAMHLMRHSDPKLTMKIYTDASQLALVDSIAMLPCIGVRVGQLACND